MVINLQPEVQEHEPRFKFLLSEELPNEEPDWVGFTNESHARVVFDEMNQSTDGIVRVWEIVDWNAPSHYIEVTSRWLRER